MLESVQAYLSNFGLVDERIIFAMEKVDRLNFVNDKEKDIAYLDTALEIGEDQTISQPSTVGRMISLLQIKDTDQVLEIGTGSGWSASLMASMATQGKITTLEQSETLANRALEKIKKSDIKNIVVGTQDFRLLVEKFDKIIFTAGITSQQEMIIVEFAQAHLKKNGILVCPFQSGPLIFIQKKKGKLEKFYTEETYVFVPLILK